MDQFSVVPSPSWIQYEIFFTDPDPWIRTLLRIWFWIPLFSSVTSKMPTKIKVFYNLFYFAYYFLLVGNIYICLQRWKVIKKMPCHWEVIKQQKSTFFSVFFACWWMYLDPDVEHYLNQKITAILLNTTSMFLISKSSKIRCIILGLYKYVGTKTVYGEKYTVKLKRWIEMVSL